jgi:two-component system, OmpR family, response regulator RegX3
MDMVRVLLVEDDPELLELLAFLLRIEGFAVIAAASRDKAHAALSREQVDLVIADSVLRGGNGDDVAIAARSRGIRVIVTSGDLQRIIRLENGPFPFIAKPYSANELLALMRSVLRAPGN